jgi:transcriptional regulator with XRE-family HTH domain
MRTPPRVSTHIKIARTALGLTQRDLAAAAAPASPQFTARLIRLTRIARGWRQTDLAHALDISRERISQLETGRSVPGPDLLDRLAAALDSADLRELATAWRTR